MSLQCPEYDCSRPDEIHLQLTPYPDISGRGVIIGFVGTAYIVVVFLILNYLVAYDPETFPFQSDSTTNQISHRAPSDAEWWKPNPIDVVFLRRLRRVALWLMPVSTAATGWEFQRQRISRAFDSSIKGLCDVQLMTGLAILISGFSTLDCGLSSYHWQILVCLAWFACVTHLAGLTSLRRYLHSHPWEKVIRYILSLCLMGALLAAIVPTAFFNWGDSSPEENSLAAESTPARCFFNLTKQRNYQNQRVAKYRSQNHLFWDMKLLEETHAFQTMVFTSGLLILSLLNRTVKLFKFLTTIAYTRLRIPLKKRIRSFMIRSPAVRAPHLSIRNQESLSPTDILLKAVHTAFLLNLDLFNSMLAEIYWLAVLLVWGTFRLAGSLVTGSEVVTETESQWTFGQILPVILLIAPLASSLGAFVRDDVSSTPQASAQNPPARRIITPPRLSVAGTNHAASQARVLPNPIRLTILPTSGSIVPSPGTERRLSEPDITPTASSHYDEEEVCYSDMQWLSPCIASIWGTVILYTFSYIVLTLGPTRYRVGDGWSPVEVWFSLHGIFYTLLLLYPASCVSIVFIGLYIDHRNAAAARQHWRIWSKVTFWIFGTVIQLLPMQLIYAAMPLWASSIGWLVLAMLYGLASLYSCVRPARAPSVSL